MGKKILILNGSPRLHGNTASLCDALIKGAEASGHTVTRFNLQKMKINGCLGCFKGGKDPLHPCVQKDDMGEIYPSYVEADIVVLASPLYYWTFSGQLKIVMDRLFAVAECDPNYHNPKKECVLLMAAEDVSKENWEALSFYYEKYCGFMGWKDRGRVLAGGFLESGSIRESGTSFLNAAEELGRSL